MSSSDELGKALAPYLTLGQVLVLPLSTLSVMFFIYGVYAMVFGLSIHVLLRKQASLSPSNLYVWCTVVLFGLDTLLVGGTVIIYTVQSTLTFNAATSKDYTDFLSYLRNPLPPAVVFATVTSNMCSCIMNAVADCMLIYRCYVVWDFRRLVLYPFATVAFILNGINIGTYVALIYTHTTRRAPDAFRTASSINNWTTIAIAIFTLVVACMTGGRIWWMSHRARRLIGMPSNPKYIAIVQIIIESGLLYASFLIINIVVLAVIDPKSTAILPFNLAPISTQLSGLAPTLIIVRVAYGTSVESVQQMVSTLRFAESGSHTQAPSNSSEEPNQVTDLRRWTETAQKTQDISADLEAGKVVKTQ